MPASGVPRDPVRAPEPTAPLASDTAKCVADVRADQEVSLFHARQPEDPHPSMGDLSLAGILKTVRPECRERSVCPHTGQK